MTMLTRRGALSLAVASPFLRPAAAASWPDRPVRLINTGAPGSGIDLVSRVLGDGLAQRYGQPFPVENRPTGGMLPAGEAHATARPGESLLVAATGIASTVPLVAQGRLPFDPDADLVPVAAVASEFLGFAVPAASPARSVQDVLEAAKAQPGALNWYCVPGFMDLHFRLYLHEHRLDMTQVAYRGSPPAVLDLVAERLQFGIVPLSSMLAAWRDGKLRVLAVCNAARAPAMPEVPTVAEAGLPALTYDPVTALFGWRGMPAAAREELSGVAGGIMRSPAGSQRLTAGGLLVQGSTPDELAGIIAAQRARMQQAIGVLGRPTG